MTIDKAWKEYQLNTSMSNINIHIQSYAGQALCVL